MLTNSNGDKELPYVSVIIPVLNNPSGIRKCLEALLVQTYSKEKIEIIVVDNSSTDNTPKVIADYPVQIIFEKERRSPYSARNKALEICKGEIVAFTDSDCIPDRSWIEKGVETLHCKKADLVGGHVAFYYSNIPTAAEIFDSITNLEVRNNVKKRGVAKTGNLFVKREVFNKIGFFPSDIRSGGDVEWTGKATSGGYKITYDKEVLVRKKARKLSELLKKQIRVGYGQPRIWKEQNKTRGEMLKTFFIDLRPVSPRTIKKMINSRGRKEFEQKMISLLIIAWLSRLATNLGRLAFLMNPKG